MFWKSNTSSSSELDTLLSREDITLQEVMDCEDIINECKVQGKTLIDFLLKPEMMEELVNMTTKEPSLDVHERFRFKYPNIACELLTSDVPAINERLASDKELLDKLYRFLENEPPLNPLLASYFSKIIGALITKKTEQNWLSYQFTCLQVLDFLKDKDTFISLLLKHIGTSAIMDLMLKLMTQVECIEMKETILNWLDCQGVIQSLICLLNGKVDKDRHYYAAQLLCDFIRITRDNLRNSTERVSPDPLLNTLESPATVSLLLDNILEDKCESAIVGGIQVLLALLDVNQSSIPKFNSRITYNSETNDDNVVDNVHKDEVERGVVQSIVKRLKDFHNILLDPPHKAPINTTICLLKPPLGNTRLQVIKLICSIISSNNNDLLNEFVELGTFSVLLDLFFKYQWNNFLHTQVENCLVAALKTYQVVVVNDDDNDDDVDKTASEENLNALTRHLLVDCKLIERILDTWNENDEQQKQSKGLRQGYMGHLISLVNKIAELCSDTTALGQFIKNQLPDVWKLFEEFKSTTLNETNTIQNTLLGGSYPKSLNEGNDDYGDVAFPQEQMYSHYQMQHLASHTPDGYSGFNDDAFNDGDDTLQTIDHRTDMNFGIDDLLEQHELFKQVCAQNINTLDDADDQIFEDRDHTLQTVIEKGDRNETMSSSDSDDDSPPGVPMEIDAWSKTTKTRAVEPIELSDPWGTMDDTNHGNSDQLLGGWADFSSASFGANFNEAFADAFKKNNNKINDDLLMMKVDDDDDNIDFNNKTRKNHQVIDTISSNIDDNVASQQINKSSSVGNLSMSDKDAAGDNKKQCENQNLVVEINKKCQIIHVDDDESSTPSTLLLMNKKHNNDGDDDDDDDKHNQNEISDVCLETVNNTSLEEKVTSLDKTSLTDEPVKTSDQ